MKKYILFIAAALLLGSATMSAQTDSRNRTAETIVADGLAQLPTQSSETFNAIMNELASTGDKGILQIASRLVPPANGKNAVFEYAIGGITDLVTTKNGEKYRASVRKGLAEAIEKCNDYDNKAFLLTQLAKCATKEDMPVFSKYLKDSKLSDLVIMLLTSIPGNDTELAYLVKNTDLPHLALAKMVTARNIQGVEDVLLGWTNDSDAKTLKEVYNALATVGTSKSVDVLADAAKKVNYGPDPTFATNAYAKLLESLENDTKTVQKGAKALMKSETSAVRCAGLNLLLKSSGKDGVKNVLSALKDDDIEYRNTALACGLEYCGEPIFTEVTNKFGKLSEPAQVDVMRWIGNNHAKAGEAVVLKYMASSDTTLAREAMLAASKIGGNTMLADLLKYVSGPNAKQAKAALLSFNGKINDGVVRFLNSSEDAKALVPLLEIAGTRHIHEAYQRVAKLTGSSDASVSNAAFTALSGVASPDVYGDICAMLDKSSGESTAKLQKAACSALAGESAEVQFNRFKESMKNSSHPEYYYQLLAQAGSDKAIAVIEQGMKQSNTKEAASAAMLNVDNSAVLPILINMARSAQGEQKDKTISRYLTLVDKAQVNAVRKYQLLRDALELNPSDAQVNKILSALRTTNTVQALNVAANYLGSSTCYRAAAEAVRGIISSNGALNGGADIKNALQKAVEAFSKDKANGDADAGYAIDDVNGLLSKTTATGFTLGSGTATLAAGSAPASLNKDYENFQITVDFKGSGKATATLRGVPVFTIDGSSFAFVGPKEAKALNAEGEWNTLEIKVVDDRIFTSINGTEIAANALLPDMAGLKTAPATGKVEVAVNEGELQIRDLLINELPSTPVFKLSPEEEKEGFEVLFDGRSLEKWQGNKTNYTTENGEIIVTAAWGGSGNLYTNKKYRDFVFRFDFCFAQPGMNNGIGVRTNIGTDAAYDGMEIQILDHDDPIYADLHDYQQHGAVYGIIVPKRVKFGETGTWNSEEIRVVGDHITVTVNGEVILDGNIREACKGHNVAPDGSDYNPYTVDHKNHPGLFNKDGYISFCGHGPGIKFRNVRVLDLSNSKKKRR